MLDLETTKIDMDYVNDCVFELDEFDANGAAYCAIDSINGIDVDDSRLEPVLELLADYFEEHKYIEGSQPGRDGWWSVDVTDEQATEFIMPKILGALNEN